MKVSDIPAPDDGLMTDRIRRPHDRPGTTSSVMFAQCLAGRNVRKSATEQERKKEGRTTPLASRLPAWNENSPHQTQVKSVEENHGIDNLHLTVARSYIAKLLQTNGYSSADGWPPISRITWVFRRSPKSTPWLDWRGNKHPKEKSDSVGTMEQAAAREAEDQA